MNIRSQLINCNIKECKTEEEINSTYQVMHQLRQHIKAEDYLNKIYFLMKNEKYRLWGAYDGENQCIGVVGFQRQNRLHLGDILYIADLVTDERFRSHGIGSVLINKIKEEAANQNVDAIVLDSGIQRKKTHEFYQKHGYKAESYSFRIFKPY